jgi:hypothetical protein
MVRLGGRISEALYSRPFAAALSGVGCEGAYLRPLIDLPTGKAGPGTPRIVEHRDKCGYYAAG